MVTENSWKILSFPEIPENALSGLILVSKLIKDVAMAVTDRWEDPIIISFISKYNRLVLSYIHSLMVTRYQK
jgi:hypothetical protein